MIILYIFSLYIIYTMPQNISLDNIIAGTVTINGTNSSK